MLDTQHAFINNELMRKKLLALAVLVLSLTLVSPAFAAGLAVTSIGNLDTSSGTFYNAWWYTQENPILSGTAAPSASVSVSIDGVAATTTANTLGTWSYTPTTLITGNHTVLITSGTETVSFSIEIGSEAGTASVTTIPLNTSTSSGTTTLPDSGVGIFTILAAAGGMLALGFGVYNFAFAKES